MGQRTQVTLAIFEIESQSRLQHIYLCVQAVTQVDRITFKGHEPTTLHVRVTLTTESRGSEWVRECSM